jgi:hypothetical protein
MFGENKLLDGFKNDEYAKTINQIEAPSRIAYLKKVYLWTLGGLFLASLAGIAMAFAIANTPMLQGTIPFLIIVFGGMFVAHGVCASMVAKPSSAIMGFVVANVVEGITLGYILLQAMVMSAASTGDPFLFIAQALGMTLLVTLSIAAYVWTNPSEFRWAGAIMSALGLPMLVFMVLMFVMPSLFGGPFGMIITIVFVAISIIGLLKSTSDVMHHFNEDQVIPGAFLISMGILILFWNILVLIMRLQGRD